MLAEPDPDWSATYESWRSRLARALASAAVRIEHVGSTAVPGLPAKPVIDVQVSVADVADEPAYLPALESLGLQLRAREDGHRYLRPLPHRPREVHVHVCAAGSDWEREHLLFRDYLRGHEAARTAYAAVKAEAVVTWADDRLAYTDAKGAVIRDLLRDAEEWAGGTGWALGG